jgi:putative membrane protein
MSDETRKDQRVVLAEERTGMASFPTSLALDRTTLAWIRTTLTMTSFGLGIIGFFRSLRIQQDTPASARMHQQAIHFGVALVVMGISATLIVAVSHLSALRKLRAGQMLEASRWPLSITISLLLALLALYGLWEVFLQ